MYCVFACCIVLSNQAKVKNKTFFGICQAGRDLVKDWTMHEAAAQALMQHENAFGDNGNDNAQAGRPADRHRNM
jgi:hypothetical protein